MSQSVVNETQSANVMPRRDVNLERSVERSSKTNYVADVNFSMQYTRWFLILLGIWPDVTSNSTKSEKLVSRFLMPFPSLVITLLVIPLVSIPIFRSVTPRQLIVLLGPLSFRTSSVIKNVILISRRRAIKLCIEHMETDWRRIENDRDREIMRSSLRIGRSLTIICVSCFYSSTIFYNSLPFILPRKINALNETVRPITVPGIDIYVDLHAGYNYEIVIFTSCISIFYVSAIIAAICNLAAILVYHACGQIQVVMTKLESLIGEDRKHTNDAAFQSEISLVIRIHVRALRFASKIDEVLRELCFMEVIAATWIICLIVYIFLTDPKSTGIATSISYVMLLLTSSSNIFIFCLIGELLKQKCEAVGQAAYMTEWYKLPGKSGLILVMFITMSNYPRRLTAGRVVELSISTFGAIMKTSFGYSNMLRTMTQ